MTIDKLKEIFNTVFEGDVDITNISEETRLFEDLGMNSIGMLYMAMTLEEECKIKFVNEDFEKLVTVGDVLKLIESKGK